MAPVDLQFVLVGSQAIGVLRGNGEMERTSLADDAGHGEIAVEHHGEFFADDQAEPGSAKPPSNGRIDL